MEVDDLVFDPIILLLNLAVLDRAFINSIRSMQDLLRLRPGKGKPHLQLHWHPDKRKTPICREPVNTVNGRETSPDKGLTNATFRRHLNRLGEHAGFEQIVNAYAESR